MDLYNRIRQRREQLGFSQDELAKILGYKDRSAIAKIESGVNDLTQSKIAAFAKALKTTPAYLMGWDEEKPTTVSDDGLWASICEDKTKLMLARWISNLNTDQLEMVVGLLEAARLTPEK